MIARTAIAHPTVRLPYEQPEDPALVLRTVELTADQAADRVVALMLSARHDARSGVLSCG
jgi:adenylylsulfate kinase-like enzyme